MAFAWKTNGLPTAWRRIAEAKMSPRPVSMNNARAPCQYQRPNSSPKIGITVSFYLSSSGGSSRRDASKGAGAWRGGEGRDEEGKEGRRGEEVSVSSRWNRAENGKSSDLVTNGWSPVGWSVCQRVKGRERERTTFWGEYTAVIGRARARRTRKFG